MLSEKTMCMLIIPRIMFLLENWEFFTTRLLKLQMVTFCSNCKIYINKRNFGLDRSKPERRFHKKNVFKTDLAGGFEMENLDNDHKRQSRLGS